MACSNNPCSCGYGTLSCIAGPLTHCGCCPGNSQYYQNYPFYTGPCGSVSCSGCDCGSSARYHWGGWNAYPGWGGCCAATVSPKASNLCSTGAHFSVSAPLMIASGAPVPLQPAVLCPESYACGEEGILIRRPGTYMAVFTAHIPALQSVSTRMYLTLNGEMLDASAQDVATVGDATTGGSTAHLIFHALPNSLLQLVSSDEISLTGSDAANVFKLTLIRL